MAVEKDNDEEWNVAVMIELWWYLAPPGITLPRQSRRLAWLESSVVAGH